MRTLASRYLDHFDIDLGPTPTVTLSKHAPDDLRELDRLVAEIFGPGHLVGVYEALSKAAETDFPHLEPVDENVCPMDVYFFVLDFLGTRLS